MAAGSESGFKGMGERPGQGMAEALFIKGDEAFACYPPMPALHFHRGIDLGGFEVAALDQAVNTGTGDGKQLGDTVDFDERRDRFFFQHITICNHIVELMSFMGRFISFIDPFVGEIRDISQRLWRKHVNFVMN